MKKIFAVAVMCSIAASIISESQYNTVYADPVEITCNVDGKSEVSNVGENAYPLVTVEFDDAVDEATLNSSTIKIYRGDSLVEYTPYSVSSDSYVIDLKEFSFLEATSSNPQSYDPTVSENCRIELSGVKLADGSEIDDKSFEFSTSLVLPVAYEEGCTIQNIALGKDVIELGTSKVSGDDAAYVTDGRQFNEWKVLRENVAEGNAAFKIDLGREYNIAGVAIAGVNGAWYDRKQVIGGSNDGNLTSMSDMTRFVTGTINMANWNQIVSAFYDYNNSSKFRYIYGGSNTTCLGCRELYVWAYVPELVESTIPKKGEISVTNVGADAINNLEILFFDEMVPGTLNPDSIIITDSENNVLLYNDYTADSFSYTIPITTFKQNKTYTVTVTESVQKQDGTRVKEYKFTFTTAAISMGKKPITDIICSTYPEDGAEDITGETEKNVVISFSYNIEESTLSNETVRVYDEDNNKVPYGDAVYEDNTYKIPMGIFESDSEYTVKISDIVTEEGYESDGEYGFSFKTGTVVGTVSITSLIGYCSLDDNSEQVTNVDENACIDVCFNKKVQPDSLKNAVVIKDSAGNVLSGLNYSVSEKLCRIDMGKLKSDSEYMLVIYKDKIDIPGITVEGENIEIPFKTALIFSETAVDGTRIMNAARGKTVYSKKGSNVNMIVDGDITNNYQISNDTLLIDLGGYYEVIAIRHSPTSYYDYTNGANWWHTDGIQFLIGNEKNFELTGFTSVHTTIASGDPVLIPVSTEDRYARYIAITNPSKMAVIGDIDVYVRVGLNFGELSGRISGNNCTVTQSVLNYTGSQETAHMIFCEYDSEDRLIAVSAQEVTVEENQSSIQKTIALDAVTSKVKVFVSKNVNSFDMQSDVLLLSR